MNDDQFNIIDTEETVSQKNKFPIVAQLGVLGIILVGLFGTLLFHNVNSEPELATPEPTPLLDSKQQPVVPQKITDVEVVAKAAYVWDVRSQRALFSKNADESLPLASITKLMTALLAHELISEDETTTVPLSAIQQEGSSGLLVGEQLTVEELNSLALISSSNDAAYALAASVGQLLGDNDPTTQFVKGMNIRADELGFETLEFWNTTGLDLSETEPGAVGSAKDISFLMEYIITNYPEIITPTQQTATRVYNTAGAYHEVENTNDIAIDIPNLIGSKTGFTDIAGGNLTIAFEVGLNRPMIITVLGSTREERFNDVLTLVEAVQNSIGQQ